MLRTPPMNMRMGMSATKRKPTRVSTAVTSPPFIMKWAFGYCLYRRLCELPESFALFSWNEIGTRMHPLTRFSLTDRGGHGRIWVCSARAAVAQWIEHQSSELRVGGSSPSSRAKPAGGGKFEIRNSKRETRDKTGKREMAEPRSRHLLGDCSFEHLRLFRISSFVLRILHPVRVDKSGAGWYTIFRYPLVHGGGWS